MSYVLGTRGPKKSIVCENSTPTMMNRHQTEHVQSLLGAKKNNNTKLKFYKSLTIMALFELCVAVLTFTVGIGCTSYGTADNHRLGPCQFGTGIWVGVIGMATATLGIAAFGVPKGRKGFMVAYVVFCIVASLTDLVLIALSAVHIDSNSYFWNNYGDSQSLAAISFNSLLLITGASHMVLCIISSAFVCYNWTCCDETPNVIVVYASPPAVNDSNGDHKPNGTLCDRSGMLRFFPPIPIPGQMMTV